MPSPIRMAFRGRAALLAGTALCGAMALLAATRAEALPTPVDPPTLQAGGAGGAPVISASGVTMSVLANAQNTIIKWTTYTVASNETVDYALPTASGVVLNEVPSNTTADIEGAINAYVGEVGGKIGGNVWFAAPGGIIFGPMAVVNVGGLLATTLVPDEEQFLANGTATQGLGTTASYSFATGTLTAPPPPPPPPPPPVMCSQVVICSEPPPSPPPPPPPPPPTLPAAASGTITVESGAQINGTGSLIALIAPEVAVQAGAAITNSAGSGTFNYNPGDILYGAADGFTVNLVQESAGDLDLLQFVINSPTDLTNAPLVLQGTTVGNNVYVASLSATSIADAVVNATGFIEANQAAAGTSGEVILSTQSDTIAPGQSPSVTTMTISPADLQLGAISAASDLKVLSSGAISGAGALTAGGPMTLLATGAITLASVVAGGALTADSTTSGSPIDPVVLGSFPGFSTSEAGQGTGGVAIGTATAGGAIDLEANFVYAGSLSGASIQAVGFGQGLNGGYVDVGTAASSGLITLWTSGGGYVALQNLNLAGSGAAFSTLLQPAESPPFNGEGTWIGVAASGPVYLGYAQSEQGSGDEGAGGAVGSITGAGPIELFSAGDVDTDLIGPANLDGVFAGVTQVGDTSAGQYFVASAGGGSANLTAGGVDGYVFGLIGVDVTATSGDATISVAQSDDGPVTVSAPLGAAAVGIVTSPAQATISGAQASLGSDTGFSGIITGDIHVTATDGPASVGPVASYGSVYVSATGGEASLYSASLSPGGDGGGANLVQVTASGGGADAVIGGDGQGFISGASSVTLSAGQDAIVDVTGPISLTSIEAGRNVTVLATGDIAMDSVVAGGALTADSTTNGDPIDPVVLGSFPNFSTSEPGQGTGGVTIGTATAGGAIDLEANFIYAGSLSGASIQAVGFGQGLNGGSVDVGTATSSGLITLWTSGGGYVALQNLNLTGSGAAFSTLLQPAGSPAFSGYGTWIGVAASGPVYLGYAQSQQGSDDPGPGAAGSITGAGPIELFSAGDVDTDLLGAANFDAVFAGVTQAGVQSGSQYFVASAGGGSANLTAASVSGYVLGVSGVDVAATAGSANLSVAYSDSDIHVAASDGAASVESAVGDGGVYISATGGEASLYSASLSPGDTANLVQVTASGSGADAVIGGGDGQGFVSGASSITLSAGQDAIVDVTGPISLASVEAGRNVSLTTAQPTGSTAPADLSAVEVSAGGAIAVDVPGTVSIGSAASPSSILIEADGLNLTEGLTAPNVDIDALTDGMLLGGATAPASPIFWLSNAQFALIDASAAVNISPLRGDLTVANLDVDPAATPVVNLSAAAGQTVSVEGEVAPVTDGGTLDIGGSTILISGSLGTATLASETQFTGVRAFAAVSLDAANDILMGSSGFMSSVEGMTPAQIGAMDAFPPQVQASGDEIGHVFVVAGRLNLSASGEIVQQNTSGAPVASGGVYLTNGPGAGGVVLSIAGPPTLVDLFGSYVNAAGNIVSGPTAARSSELEIAASGLSNSVLAGYRFNGCEIGAAGSCGGEVIQPEEGFDPSQDSQQDLIAGDEATAEIGLQPSPPLLAVPPAAGDQQPTDAVLTGSGNEEIWRGREGGSQ